MSWQAFWLEFMRVIGIETSCDETAVAVYDDGRGAAFASALQSDCDASGLRRGGTRTCLAGPRSPAPAPGPRGVGRGGLGLAARIDGMAYTAGPGLIGALLVGAGFAQEPGLCLGQAGGRRCTISKGICWRRCSSRNPPAFPFLALLVSGGPHAAGRCRRSRPISAPGRDPGRCGGGGVRQDGEDAGTALSGRRSARAIGGDRHQRPLRLSPAHARSSGARLQFQWLEDRCPSSLAGPRVGRRECRADVARGFQEAVIETLAEKSRRALLATGHRRLVVAGGVGANRRLRERLRRDRAQAGAQLYFPRAEFCTDNGAMIALAGCLRLMARGAPRARFGRQGEGIWGRRRQSASIRGSK